jgi:hypothetical protein
MENNLRNYNFTLETLRNDFQNQTVQHLQPFYGAASITSAAKWHLEEAIVLEKTLYWVSAFLSNPFVESGKTQNGLTLDDIVRPIKAYINQLTEDILDRDGYEHNSTSAVTNIINICDFKAMQNSLKIFKRLIKALEG